MIDVIPYAISEFWGTEIGWWAAWIIGFICMVLASGKKDIWIFISAAIFAPLVVTIMLGIFTAPLILLTMIFKDALGLLVWLNGFAVAGGIVSFSIALAKRKLRLDNPKRYE
jgi:hypothetical protein